MTSIVRSNKATRLLAAILKGDPSVYKALYSDRDDVTLGNPFGPYARGRKKVEEQV